MKNLLGLFTILVGIWIANPLGATAQDKKVDPKKKDFTSIDLKSQTVPLDVEAGSIASLSGYLCRDLDDKLDKVRALSVWITSNIEFDFKDYFKPGGEERSLEQIMTRKKGTAQEYSRLFQLMCYQNEIECYEVKGYHKDLLYVEGTPFHITNHVWNMVKIEEQYYMIDLVYFGGLFRHEAEEQNKYKEPRVANSKDFERVDYITENKIEKYFLAQSKDWILTHLPADPTVQFMQRPVRLSTFEQDSMTIKAYLASPDWEYSYKLKYGNFDRADPDLKEAEMADEARVNNPNNNLIVAETYLVRALDITEKRTRQPNKLKNAKRFFTEGLQAAQTAKIDNTKFYSLQKQKLRERNKNVLALNKKYTSENTRFEERFNDEIGKIDERISRSNERLKDGQAKASEGSNDNLKSVKRPEKEVKPEFLEIFETNLTSIAENEEKIPALEEKSKKLSEDIQEKYKVIYGKWAAEHDQYDTIFDIMQALCRLNYCHAKQSALAPYHARLDNFKSNPKTIWKEEIADVQAQIKSLQSQKFSADSARVAILKANKIMTKQNKRYNTDPEGQEDKQYDLLNKQLNIASMAKLSAYDNQMAYYKELKNKLRKDRAFKKAENQWLKAEYGTQDFINNERAVYLETVYTQRKDRLTALITKSRDRLRIVDKLMREEGLTGK